MTQCPKVQCIRFGQHFYELPNDLPEHKSGAAQPSVLLHHKTFGDLDEDTVRLLAGFLGSQDLFPLAITCSNLRDWILPIYLRRAGYSASEGIVYLGDTSFLKTAALISALTLCRSVTMLSQLVFRVQLLGYGRSLEGFALFECLHRLLRLLHKVSKIDTIILDFGGPPKPRHGVIEHGAKARWRQLTFSILCVMAEKSEHISVEGLGQFGDLTNTHRAQSSLEGNIPLPLITHLLRFVQVNMLCLKLQVVQRWIQLALPQASTTIKHLSLPSLNPVVAVFLPIVVETFSEITWLTVRGLHPGNSVTPNEVLRLLHQLPLLTTLELDPFEIFHDGLRFHYPPIENLLPTTLLPNLRSLTCAPTFLKFVVDNNAGPKLERAHVFLLDIEYDWRASMGHFLGSARLISESVRGLRARATFSQIRLELTMSYTTLLSRLQPQDLGDPAWAVLNEETAELYIRGTSLGNDTHGQGFDSSDARIILSKLENWLKDFRKLQKLVFWEIPDLLKDDMDPIIGKWNLPSICPTLEKVHVGEAERLYGILPPMSI
ncbi:hypothetical protein H0H92_009321 [Tricholoma furcatifolium]|nr:hypothetical protein H0H92_009321 [Tricholoma furcatifolium]